MNGAMGDPQIGQWYERTDKADDIFQVTGIDEAAGTIEVQSIAGDIDELDFETWISLPLGLAQPPEDWLELIDDMEAQDFASEGEALLENPVALDQFANPSG
jgi:hypothetical protein